MAADSATARGVLIRDLLIFQLKLLIDGFKDIAVAQAALLAAVADLFFGGARRGRFFYAVMRISERFDLWLNLNGASGAAGQHPDGLFGFSRAGSDSLLGKVEEMVRGPESLHEGAAAAGRAGG